MKKLNSLSDELCMKMGYVGQTNATLQANLHFNLHFQNT
jgi:hypothetical protein